MAIVTLGFGGTNIETFNVTATTLTAWRDVPGINYSTVPLVNTGGVSVLSQGVTMQPRAITIGLYVPSAVSLATRVSTVNDFLRQIRGEIEFSTVEDTRVCFGYLRNLSFTTLGPALYNLVAVATITLVCFDPLWYAPAVQTISIPTLATPVVIPMGSASAVMQRITARIVGAGVDPVLTWKNGGGDTLGQMRFTVTLGASDDLEIRCTPELRDVRKFVSGVESDGLSLLNVLDGFMELDPQDAPTATLTATSGTPTAEIDYRLPYLI